MSQSVGYTSFAMPDPIAIERDFQELKQDLRLLGSGRMRMLRLLDFIEPLLIAPSRLFPVAYLPELLPFWYSAILQSDLTATHFTLLDRAETVCTRISDLYPEICREGDMRKAQERLAFSKARGQQQMGLRERHSWTLPLDRSDLNLLPSFHPDGVWIPLVEQELLLDRLRPSFAILRRLQVEVYPADKAAGRDELHLEQFTDPREAAGQGNEPIFAATRHIVQVLIQRSTKDRVRVHCRLDRSLRLTGESLQAALAVLISGSLLRWHQHRQEFQLHPLVAITGGVAADGTLMPVDEQGLRLKVEACAFSWIRYLVVPQSQADLCRQELQRHSASHEDAAGLEVIGIGKLEEIYHDRRLVLIRNVPAAVRLGRKAWKRRRSITAALLLFLLLAVLKSLWGPIDPNPVMAEYRGKFLLVENRFGEVLDRIDLGNAVSFAHIPFGPLQRFVNFYDIDEDGWNEVIYLAELREEKQSYPWILCKSIRTGTILWHFRPYKDLSFVVNTDINTGKFEGVLHIITGDYDRDGRPEVYLSAAHAYFPCLIFKLDARNGQELDHYLHIGALAGMYFTDINQDGAMELIASGQNNAYRQACLLVLDPRQVQGHSPLTPEYAVRHYQGNKELAYLLLPKLFPKLVKNYESPFFATQYCLELSGTEDFPLVAGIEEEVPDRVPFGGHFFIYLNHQLAGQRLGTANSFDAAMAKLAKDGRIARKLDQEVIREYLQSILYWNGTDWQNQPTFLPPR